MGIDIKGFRLQRQGLQLKLEQVAKKGERSVKDVMEREVIKLTELAREYAPVDEGDLEKAIDWEFDYGGINGRKQFYLRVDPNAVDGDGKSVLRYANIMHEMLAPYGSGRFNLGPGSVKKDAGRGVVGGKFIERAFKTRKKTIVEEIRKAFERGLK